MKTHPILIAVSVAVAVVALGTNQAVAAARTWDGSDSVNFNLAANWDTLPVSNQDTLVFSGTSPSGTTLNNDFAADFPIFDMQFTTTSLAYTIGGNDLILKGNIVLLGVGASPQIINTNLKLTGGAHIMQANGGNITLRGVLSDNNGAFPASIRKTSTGTLFLQGHNSYTGGTEIQAGAIAINKTDALGTGNITIGSNTTTGTLVFQTGSAGTYNQTIDLAGTTGGATLTASQTGGVNLAADFTATGAGSKTLTLTGSQVGEISGAIVNNSASNTTSVAKTQGGGTWTLSGQNTYTGNTTVSAGTLILADGSQTTFAIGASGVNNQVIQSDTGILTLDGAFVFDLSGAGTTLGDAWTIVSGTATYGATFSVLNFTETGVGSGVWEKVNSGVTYQFDQSLSTLSVTAVPESSTWALLGAGLAAMAFLRRSRRLKS